jgi:hypothetical protein
MRHCSYPRRYRPFLAVLGDRVCWAVVWLRLLRWAGFCIRRPRKSSHQKWFCKRRVQRLPGSSIRGDREDSKRQTPSTRIDRTMPVHIIFVSRRGIGDEVLFTESASDSENNARCFPVVVYVKLEFVRDFVNFNSFPVNNLPRDKSALASATARDIGPLDFSPVFQQSVSRQPQSECEYRDENSGHSGCGVAVFINNVKDTSGIDGNVISDRERAWWALVFGLLGCGGCLACYAVIKQRRYR